jgi:hypothetical protein
MGRPPTPTAILDTKGTFLKHPEFKRPNEPKGRAISKTPPKDFTPDQKALWKELMKMLAPGVAFESDRWALRHLVILEAKSRDPNIIFKDCDHTKLLNYLDRFGLNASARAKVSAEPPKESKLSKFLNQPTAKRPTAPISIPLPPLDALPN